MTETALIQRSMGNMGGGINNLSKNLEMSS